MDATQVTAVILTRNEERNLPRALSSLPHGMPVLVVDAESTDGTVAFARGSGARVLERPWTNFVDARRFALAHVETLWLLQLDADEELDDRLRDALIAADGRFDGYTVTRTTSFHGKPMRMWQGERLLRVVKTARASIEANSAVGGDAMLHERLMCDGTVGDLNGTLLHYSYETAGDYQEKYASYTDIEAQGVRGTAGRLVTETLLLLPRFANNLIRRGAALDGASGWYIAWYSALYPVVVAWKALRPSSFDRLRMT